MIRTRLGYSCLLYCLAPLVVARLLWRAVREPAYLRHVPERFGWYKFNVAAPLIWIHAVSVGETRAAQPLIHALQTRYPQHKILLTHMTPTGRQTGSELYGDQVVRCYLPYDFPGAVRRFLTHIKPVCGIVMETEIWPNLIHSARTQSVPLYLVNARLSEKSLRGYMRLQTLVKISLQKLAGLAVQSADDAKRFSVLGASDSAITGNIKFDITPPAELLELGRSWRADFGDRPVVLIASTREGEEELLLDAMRKVDISNALLVIVPRHPQRFDKVAALLEQHGLSYQRRSAAQPVAASTRVLLGDSMGEMFAYYAACDIAIIGGSLLPYGAQNLIEACAVGKPVIIGPHTYNFAEVTQLAVEAGAALQVADAHAAFAAAKQLLSDSQSAARMAQNALTFAHVHRGATERTLELIRF